MEDKKYELTDETAYVYEHKLYRIKALKDIGDVKKGDLGGFIEKESNLSQEGNCWVYGYAYENAEVLDDAVVCAGACVYGDAKVYGKAVVYDFAQVYGNAKVYGNAQVHDFAKIFGYARVYGEARVSDNAQVYDDAWVCGDAVVKEELGGNTRIRGKERSKEQE